MVALSKYNWEFLSSTTQNLTGSGFLKVSWSGSWSCFNELFGLYYIKIHHTSLSCSLYKSLTHLWFSNIMHWLVGTILAHHIMHISQMLADFLTHCQKNRIHWYCHIGKDCRHWDTVKLIMTDNKFPDFCLSAQIYHWHQTLSVVFLEVTAWLCKFSRKCCQTPNVNNHNLSVSHLFQVKMVFHEKKKATSLYNSHTHFLKTTVPLQDATKLIYAYFLSAILTIKNCVLKQEHLIQWILLTASKTISGKTAFFFFFTAST